MHTVPPIQKQNTEISSISQIAHTNSKGGTVIITTTSRPGHTNLWIQAISTVRNISCKIENNDNIEASHKLNTNS